MRHNHIEMRFTMTHKMLQKLVLKSWVHEHTLHLHNEKAILNTLNKIVCFVVSGNEIDYGRHTAMSSTIVAIAE